MTFNIPVFFLCLIFNAFICNAQVLKSPSNALKEKTSFQTSSPWKPEIDVRSDIAIIYGVGDRHGISFEKRVASWQDNGYQTHFMTGIAWGEYQDYFLGKWDGKNHQDIGQVERNGNIIWHGGGVPYIVPVQSFLEYMKTAIIKKVIDAGITSIYLEEPEFWARAGYSEVFKQEWKKYYGFDWRPQHESAENTYLSNKLKYHLYYEAIKNVSSYAKSYGKTKGLAIKVYIATHSLVNYSSWQIVSPEASLASLPGIDGYIAQVWTGTAREPTYFDGLKKERVFENAFLEYGSMVSMTAPTGRKMFFLTDPIEDWPRDWNDYKLNYQATFTAKLLYPMVNNYEVMPWPERIYTRPYKLANSKEAVLIPKYYATQMQVMINALNDMPLSENQVTGKNGVGVLMSNSLMFQRFPDHKGYDDPQFSNFYGQTLPLLKNGVPVQTVHMENLLFKGSLQDIKVLIVSYANMKPVSADVHKYIADWVKSGGVMVYCGRDDDPYQSVMEWWNAKDNQFKVPSDHLFSLMNVKPVDGKKVSVGKGAVYLIKQNPKEFVLIANAANTYLDVVKHAYESDAKAGALSFKNNFYLQRGPYDIVSVMDESVSKEPYKIKGPVVDLFDPNLPVLSEKVINPGEQAFLYNIERIKDKTKPMVLASASRVSHEVIEEKGYSFLSRGPLKTINSMRVLLPSAPKKLVLMNSKEKNVPYQKASWDAVTSTYYLSFKNNSEGVYVKLIW